MTPISILHKQKELLNSFFDTKAILTRSYRKGGWTGKEVLIHLKDSETVMYDRLRRIISEENPVLWFFEQDLWQQRLEYQKQDIELARKVFLITREAIIETVRMHLKKYAKNEGVHSRRGIMTMKQLVEFLIWHTDHHIKQIRKIKYPNTK